MKYNTSVITYFVIPSGATSGQRIVFDGVLGEIDLYNSANQLVGQWKPSQFGIFAGTPNVGQSITIKPNSPTDSNRPAIEFFITVGGGQAAIDATDNGSGAANLNIFSANYLNGAGVTVTSSVQCHTGSASLLVIGQDGLLRGGNIGLNDASANLTWYDIQNVSPQLRALVACTNAPAVKHAVYNSSGVQVTSMLMTGTNTTVDNPILRDTTWQAFTLFNGWTGAGAPNVPFYRMMPDGTIQFTGLITKALAPVNGEKCLSVAAAYVPRGTPAFTAHSNLTVTGSQKIIIDASGNGNIYDSPAGNGSAFLSEIRYPSGIDLP